MSASIERVTALVLCGGEARRFGADKVSALLAGHALLDHVLGDLPQAWEVICVGPERNTERPARWVRESPPGGGPLAGVLAGVQAARDEILVVLAGDTPGAGSLAERLVDALAAHPEAAAAVAKSPDGQPNPLLAAYRRTPALALIGDSGHDRPARLMLDLDHVTVAVSAAAAQDVDTHEDLSRIEREGWR
jgi:molybdopterin-guanine dinucleotide biosynthesis protein A